MPARSGCWVDWRTPRVEGQLDIGLFDGPLFDDGLAGWRVSSSEVLDLVHARQYRASASIEIGSAGCV